MLKVRRDESWRNKGLTHFNEALRRYFGPAYDPGVVQGADHDPFNSAFAAISNQIGQLAFADPVLSITSSRGGPYKDIAKAQQHYLNRWVVDTAFHRHLEVVATDYLFNWSATGVMMSPRPGYIEHGDPAWWPQVFRIPQRQFGFDHTATSWETKRHSWHLTIEEMEVLRELAKRDAELPPEQREGWDLDAIERLAVGQEVAEARPELDGAHSGDVNEPVSYYTFWDPRGKVDPENTEEKGYFGTLQTLAFNSEGDAVYLKPEADYFGPRRGPHNLYGTYTVPNHPWPLSALAATWEQQRELNDIAAANNESARRYKRLMLADDADLVEIIKSAPHDFAFYHEALDKDRVMPVEIGGLNAQMQAQEARLRATLDENLGITENMRGQVASDATATEAAIANASASSRFGFVQKKFIEGMLEDLKGVLHYGLKDDRVYQFLGPEAAEDLGMMHPLYRGGDNHPVEDFELSVDISSIAYKSPEQKKQEAIGFVDLVGALSAMGAQYPYLDLEALCNEVADGAGYPHLTRVFDFEAQRQYQQLMTQQQVQPAQGQPGANLRLGKASGPTRLLQGGSGAQTVKPQDTAPDGAGSSATQTRTQTMKVGG